MCEAAAALVGVSRIVYAAPKEVAAAAGFELGSAAAELQDLLRSDGPLPVEQVDTPGAGEPFARFAAAEAQGRRRCASSGSPSPSRTTCRPWRSTATSPAGPPGLGRADRGAILEAGAGTLEIVSPEHADLIDELEVGRRIAGPVRLALEVEDSARTAAERGGGAEELALPRRRRAT